MIKITLSTKDFVLLVKGHAQPEESERYRETCAAASMLAQALAYSISKFQEQQNGILQVDYRDEPGDMLLLVVPEKWAEATVRKRFRAYGDGLELLAQSNPESVQMEWNGKPVKPEEGEQEHE